MHSNELKAAKVNVLRVYLMQSNSDSTLLREDAYDTLGNIVVRRIYSKKGRLTGEYSYKYDINNYLITTIYSYGPARKSLMNYKNDLQGHVLGIETTDSDTMIFNSRNEYDTDMNQIRSVNINSAGDSMVVKSFYNEKGKRIKSIVFDKKPDSTVHDYEYNSEGKFLSISTKGFKSETTKSYIYNSNGTLSEIAGKSKIKGSRSFETEIYGYYPNGLTSTYTKVVKNKPDEKQRAYYTFY